MIVALDTSTSLTSVACLDGDRLVRQWQHDDPRQHAEVIGPMLVEAGEVVRAAGGCTAVVVGVGPGPYTGLRVGVAAARALALAWAVPVVGVCSLDAIAAAARAQRPDIGDLVVASDARRSEVYWARYDAAGQRIAGPRVSDASAIAAEVSRPTAEWVARVVLTALAAGEQLGAADTAHVTLVDADLSVHGGDGASTEQALRGRTLLPALPLYLRRPDAAVPRGLATGGAR